MTSTLLDTVDDAENHLVAAVNREHDHWPWRLRRYPIAIRRSPLRT
jgi:hypothetical protein